MTTRRLAAALFVLTLPLGITACSSDEDSLAEPNMDQEVTTSAEAETTTERVSTTVSTIYETETETVDEPDDSAKKKREPAAAADAGGGSDKGPCEWKPAEQGSPGDEVSSYCDGRFARVGIYATDATSYMMWNGQDWELIEPAGQTFTGFRCYDEGDLHELGVPADLKQDMILCD